MPSGETGLAVSFGSLTSPWGLDAAFVAVVLDIRRATVLEGRNSRCSSVDSGTGRDSVSIAAPRNGVRGLRCF
jgi:hypothetical protein